MTDDTPAPPALTPAGSLAEGGLHELLGYQLALAAIRTTDAFARVVGKPLALHRVEFTVLQLVRENSPVTATRLARALAVTTPGVTVWLDRLEKRGLVARERSAVDRRSQNLAITADGEALVTAALQRLLLSDRELMKQLSEGERRMLLELLQKFVRLHGR